MEQYILKSIVIAVIEKFMYGANIEADIASTGECFNEEVANAKYKLCKQIKEEIDALEVKEIDLQKESLTSKDISNIYSIVNGLIMESRIGLIGWKAETLFDVALQRFKAQKGE